MFICLFGNECFFFEVFRLYLGSGFFGRWYVVLGLFKRNYILGGRIEKIVIFSYCFWFGVLDIFVIMCNLVICLGIILKW